ncbi:MAG TPA: hypothetical protein VE441_11420, partial [Mycobacterium sp.]|nr:hypothetical protein [Mycobacterium sp.]
LLSAAGSLLGTPLLTLAGCAACTQQQDTSPFVRTLNSGGDTVPGVSYTVIETVHDEIVTPYRSAFLSGPQVENITLQSQCPGDASDHLAITYDTAAIQDTLNALGPDKRSFQPHCGLALPLIGTPAT